MLGPWSLAMASSFVGFGGPLARYRDPITNQSDTKPEAGGSGIEIEVRHLAEQERYEAEVDGRLAAVAQYRAGDERVAFVHTETMSGFERKGIATRLVEHVLREFEGAGKTV